MRIKFYVFALIFLTLVVVSCKSEKVKPEIETKKVEHLPANLLAVINAHGGLERWSSKRALSYDVIHKEDIEKQYIDLRDRRELVVTNDYNMGFDGSNYWTDADTSVKTNPIFYKNLIFYFYAMPFVLADEGIKYSETAPLEFGGVSYPGIKISYDEGVGVSPEDEYFLHYNASNNQMAWLGYTVTYHSQEKSTKIKWIRYDDWEEIDGLKLPASIMWYKNENNKPVEERSQRYYIPFCVYCLRLFLPKTKWLS